jgi:4-hydroxy-4-methyl-2-oxoglutarate aldolase
MSVAITVGPAPSSVDDRLLRQLREISVPTLGHYIENGALDPGIRAAVFPARFVGCAVTVRSVAPDSALVHKAIGMLAPGDVLDIDMGGDTRHAPVGEVVTLGAKMRGAAAIVIDGPCTDVVELAALGLPVFSRGTSCLTTKLLGTEGGGINIPVSCGGVAVRPGDIVIGDENGVLALERAVAEELAPTALKDDREEPALRDALRAGAVLPDETGVTTMLRDRFGI